MTFAFRLEGGAFNFRVAHPVLPELSHRSSTEVSGLRLCMRHVWRGFHGSRGTGSGCSIAMNKLLDIGAPCSPLLCMIPMSLHAGISSLGTASWIQAAR
jgi:hypothetical protein